MASFDPSSLVPPPQKISVFIDLPPTVIPHAFANFIEDRLNFKSAVLLNGTHFKIDLKLEIDSTAMDEEQGYMLKISSGKVHIQGHDEAGLFYGTITLLQLLDISPKDDLGIIVPQLEIRDWPDFPHRGVLLDISRDRVPTLETLQGLVDKLYTLKINQLQLYMEHTFAYKGHEIIWQHASPLTKEDIRKLDAYSRDRGVELVPNQNSLAHMHRWIMHENYCKYAESPSEINRDIIENENYGVRSDSLCPTDPGTLELIKDLYEQLLPNFTSRQINAGLDEPNDLAKGGERSRSAITSEGSSQIYLEYLKKIYDLVKSYGADRLMQFWADFVLSNQGMICLLPKDVIPLVWGYGDGYPFESGKCFNDWNIKWYVCPGTSAWSSFGGRTRDSVRNLTQAAFKGKENKAAGFLITDWGDNGHHQPLSISYLGFLLGASLSWKAMPQEEVANIDLPRLLDLHVFKDKAGRMGKIAFQVGDLYRMAINDSSPLKGSSALFRLLVFNDDYPDKWVMDDLNPEGLSQIRNVLAEAKNSLASAKMECDDAAIIVQEYSLVMDILDFASRFGLELLKQPRITKISKIPLDTRKELKSQLEALIARYKDMWLMRSRPGGLDDSVRRLKHLVSLL